MRIGIMQPYFMPYIGYWQLMNMVDVYVIFDDVNYINRGWINRNRILLNGEPYYITIPLLGASQNKYINEIEIDKNSKLLKKQIRTVEMAYRKAPMFQEVYPLFEDIMLNTETNLVKFILHSFIMVRSRLNIHSKMILSSEIQKNTALKGQERIIEICKILGATEYVNAIGGKTLYNLEDFKNNELGLKFLYSEDISYPQFAYKFQPNLSILDMMMFLPQEEISNILLNQFRVE